MNIAASTSYPSPPPPHTHTPILLSMSEEHLASLRLRMTHIGDTKFVQLPPKMLHTKVMFWDIDQLSAYQHSNLKHTIILNMHTTINVYNKHVVRLDCV